MTFEEISQDIKCRKEAQGEVVSNLQSRRLAAIEIVEGFRTVGEAYNNIEGLKETGNRFATAWGYEADWQCLQWAVGMFLPSRVPKDMQAVILDWYEEVQ